MALPTRDEFIRFIETKVINQSCERCGTDTWAVPETDKGMLINLPLGNPTGGMMLGPSIPAAIAVCINCGNIRAYATLMIKPEKPDG